MNDPKELCIDEPRLFSSPFLETFDEVGFLEENPTATIQEVRRAKARHTKGSAIAIPAARNLCMACPMLQAGCKKSVLETQAKDVYGVLGGATQEVRIMLQKEKRETVTVGDILANAKGDLVAQVGFDLVKEYTKVLEKTSA